jgi:hypothetical protein
MMDLVLRPDFVNALVARYVDAKMHELDQIERLGLLDAGALNVHTGSGAYGYTRDLPAEASGTEGLPCRQLWGCGNAQIFSAVSPDMHWEFSLKHELRWLERWGLNYYGCCEPLDRKFEILKHIPRLRKVSVTPWCDSKRAVEKLGGQYVLSRKPNPAILAESDWSPERARKQLTEFLDVARGCHVELIMKDVSTVRYDPKRLWDWARIASEVATG